MPSQYYHFISKVQLFFTWVNTYSGSLDWHAPRQRKLVHWQWCGVRIGVGGADSAFRVVYGQQRKSLFTFPLSFLSSRTVLHPQCLHLPFFFFSAMPFHLSCQQLLIFSIRSLIKGGFPNGSAWKESTCNAGDTGDMSSISGSGRSPE